MPAGPFSSPGPVELPSLVPSPLPKMRIKCFTRSLPRRLVDRSWRRDGQSSGGSTRDRRHQRSPLRRTPPATAAATCAHMPRAPRQHCTHMSRAPHQHVRAHVASATSARTNSSVAGCNKMSMLGQMPEERLKASGQRREHRIRRHFWQLVH